MKEVEREGGNERGGEIERDLGGNESRKWRENEESEGERKKIPKKPVARIMLV